MTATAHWKTCGACGYERITEGLLHEASADGTYYICAGMDAATASKIYVASTYNGLPVKEIGWQAFLYNETLTKVFLPDSITKIIVDTFNCCALLTTVVMPEGRNDRGECF